MKRKLLIPLPDADHYFSQLLDNEKTKGTNEQKMLVLRRRFDRILRDVTGPFSNTTNFYSHCMDIIKSTLNISEERWSEFARMKDSFNFLMHGDAEVTKKRYLQGLNRLANFVSILTNTEVPTELRKIVGTQKDSVKDNKVPVICCISSTSITKDEKKAQFNIAASKFRQELLQDKRINEKIIFTFLVTTEEGIVVRDMSDRPAEKATPTKTPRETALSFAAQELSNQTDGMLIILYGGKELVLSNDIIRNINKLSSSIHIYPISLDQDNMTFRNFPYNGQFYQMIPGCYEEFFNWLYDSLILLYQ